MKLSIIVPIYNAEKYLKRCLSAILNQNLKDWECILIDDGSTDKSRSICKSFSALDARFKLISSFNNGPSFSRNLGLEVSKGDWISFCDADDRIEQDKYEKMIAYAEKQGFEYLMCATNVIYEDLSKQNEVWGLGDIKTSQVVKITDKKILFNRSYDIGHCWDKLYKKEILENIRFPNAVKLCEDTLFNLEVFYSLGYIAYIPDRLHNYYIIGDSISHNENRASLRLEMNKTFIEDYLPKFRQVKNYDKQIDDKMKEFFTDRGFTEESWPSIDLVIPYVDCTKQKWLEDFKRSSGGDYREDENQRYYPNETLLKYKFRATEKWMPWVRKVFLLVHDYTQVPEWIDKTKVNVVLHSEFIPARFLPVFNSTAIEMFLHNIPGLSEYFIYSNDDMLPNAELKQKFFFYREYNSPIRIKNEFHKFVVKDPERREQAWFKISRNSFDLASKDVFNNIIPELKDEEYPEVPHVSSPMIKSLNKTVYEKYKDIIDASITPFRDSKNINQYLFSFYAMLHNMCWITNKYRNHYITTNRKSLPDAIKTINSGCREICLNDEESTDFSIYKDIYETLDHKYPGPCSFERS